MKKPKNLYKFFDYFGVVIFIFLIIDSVFYFNAGMTDWRVYIRFLIGIGGLSVDGFLVFFYKDKE